MISYTDLENLASSGGYGGIRQLSALSEVILLSALNSLWVTGGIADDIDASISSAVYELMTDAQLGGGMQRIGQSVTSSNKTSLSVIIPSGYENIEIHVDGILSNYSGAWVDTVAISINGDIAANYTSYTVRKLSSGVVTYTNTMTTMGARCIYAVPTTQLSVMYPHAMTIQIHRPLNGNTRLVARSNILSSDTHNDENYTSGVWLNDDPVSLVQIRPVLGTSFIADTLIVMTAYGVPTP